MTLNYNFYYSISKNEELEIPWDYEVDEDDEELIKEFLESLPKEELDKIYSDIEEVEPEERAKMKSIYDLIDYIEDIGVVGFLGDDYVDWLKDYYEEEAKDDFERNYEYEGRFTELYDDQQRGINNMTKTQIKKKLGTILKYIRSLQSEVEDVRDSIEPYEDKEDLTNQQQEKYEWLDELASQLEDAYNNLEEYFY